MLKNTLIITCSLIAATNVYAASNRPDGFKTVCKTGKACSVDSPTEVAFGASGKFVYKTLDGSFSCDAATFGSDPMPKKAKKECSISKTGSSSKSDKPSKKETKETTKSSSQASTDACGSGGGAEVCVEAQEKDGAIELSWDVSGNITGAQVYRNTQEKLRGRTRIASLAGSTTNFTDYEAESGQQYWYSIKFCANEVDYNSGVARAEGPGGKTPKQKDTSDKKDKPKKDKKDTAAPTISSDSGKSRNAKMEGFAAYAGVTGGKGGETVTVKTGTALNKALCERGSDSTPIIIKVSGTINHGNTSAQGCKTADDVIELKGKSNISIIGVGKSGVFDQIGIHLREAENIIIQNVHVKNVKKSGSPTSNGGDAIGMESTVNKVWLDHLNLEASGGEKDGYDSLVDMKKGVTNVTVSYTHFHDSSRAGLVGFNDNDTNNNITFHHNWYENIQQRTPLVRNALVHSYNNYWSNPKQDYMFHAINSRANARVLVEGNYFHNVNNPVLASKDSKEPGCWEAEDNTFTPEIYYSRTVANGQAHKDGNVKNGQVSSNCSVSVPYSYKLDSSKDVPSIVKANVGVGKI